MPRIKIYPDNKSRQKSYELRKKDREENSKPTLDWNKPLEPFLDYFKRMNNLDNIPPFQAEICNTMANFDILNLLVCSGRGSSKTMISSTFSLYLVDEYSRFIKKPLDITLISSQPTIYTHIDRIFLSHPDLKQRLRTEGKSLEIPKANFQFKDTLGFVERILPTSNQIRSHRCNCLILDECASIPTPVIKTALPLLKDDIAKVILISTPHKERSLFNDYVANLPKDWVLLQYSSELAQWTSKMRKLSKETLTPEEYEIEINGQIPQESVKTLLSSKDLESCIENYIALSGLPDTRLQIGIDWGYTRSLSCAVLCEHSKAYKRIIKTWVWNQENIENLYSELGAILLQYWSISNKQLKVLADSKPVGFIDNLKKYCFPVSIKAIDKSASLTTNADKENKDYTNIKSLLLTQLYNLVKTKHLKIPSSETELIKQLKLYKKEKVYGNDLVDALMLSIAELPSVTDSHSVWVANTKKFDSYLQPKFKDPPKDRWNRGY